MTIDPDERLRRWQDARSARLATLPWLHTDTTTHGRPVRHVKDELVVAADHEQAARDVLAGTGVAASAIAAHPAIPGFVRLRAPGAHVAGTSAALRGVASPNHVFLSNPFEMGGPYGPPTTADMYALSAGPAPDATVRLAVLDTAVWRASPLPSSWYEATDADFADELDPSTDLGHANFIVGVVMSKTDNARVRVVRVLDPDGLCTEVDLAKALLALDDVDVVNLSLGGFSLDDKPPLLLGAALRHLLHGHDRVVVAAAGNEGVKDRPYWPAAFAGSALPFAGQVLAVAAHDGSQLCSWSNTGGWVDLAAPGSDITSTYVTHDAFPTGFARWSGTSFAAPYAAAAVAARHRDAGSVVAAMEQVRKEATAQTFGDCPGLA